VGTAHHERDVILFATFISNVTQRGRCGTWSPEKDPVCEWAVAAEGRYEEAATHASGSGGAGANRVDGMRKQDDEAQTDSLEKKASSVFYWT
jgi:hypothetical protein